MVVNNKRVVTIESIFMAAWLSLCILLSSALLNNANSDIEKFIATSCAFDGDYLSNFETGNPNGNWVGMDMGAPNIITHARIVPRSDDNDVCPGNEYELVYWDNQKWVSTGMRTATDNSLVYDSIPQGALMWLRNYTRGMDERCFLIDDDGTVEWW